MARNYTIGQVLYVIPNQKANVVPVCIVERRVSETKNGREVKHIVSLPKKQAKPVILETIRGHVFDSIESVRETMYQNAHRSIDDMLSNAQRLAQATFQEPEPEPPSEADEFSLGDIDEGDDDAQPSAMVPAPQQPSNGHMPPDEGGMLDEIELPDGTKAKVRIHTDS